MSRVLASSGRSCGALHSRLRPMMTVSTEIRTDRQHASALWVCPLLPPPLLPPHPMPMLPHIEFLESNAAELVALAVETLRLYTEPGARQAVAAFVRASCAQVRGHVAGPREAFGRWGMVLGRSSPQTLPTLLSRGRH